MAIITLADMKAHLGIIDDVDDVLIQGKIDAAQAYIEQMCGFVITEEFTAPPADLMEAVRNLAAHWYENRESSVVGLTVFSTPIGVEDVIRNRRSYAWA